MFSAGDIVADVLAYWGRPSESSLPQKDVVRVLNRKLNALLLKMNLSAKGYRAVLSPVFSFGTAERSRRVTELSDFSGQVSRVESRSVGSDEDAWQDERVVPYAGWNTAMDQPVDCVAFTGSTADDITMYVNRDASSLEFRVLYEAGGVSLSAVSDEVPTFQEFFRSTLFYGVAAEAGEQITGLDPRAEQTRDKKVMRLIEREQVALVDFEAWLRNEPSGGVEYREAFNSTRSGSGQPRMHNINGAGGGYYSPW